MRKDKSALERYEAGEDVPAVEVMGAAGLSVAGGCLKGLVLAPVVVIGWLALMMLIL